MDHAGTHSPESLPAVPEDELGSVEHGEEADLHVAHGEQAGDHGVAKPERRRGECVGYRRVQLSANKRTAIEARGVTFAERDKRREENTLLHKDKDLSTSRLFLQNVPDHKHGNTQYANKNTDNCGKLKYILRTNKKQTNYSCLKLRNMQTQQSKTYVDMNFQERERERCEFILHGMSYLIYSYILVKAAQAEP